MFAKSLETRQFWNISLASFKISNADSFRVKQYLIFWVTYFQDSRKDELVEIRFDGKDYTEHKVEVPVKDVPEKNNGEKMAFGVYDEL